MTSKLNYLISISLKRKIKTKWFLIANIILAIVLVGLINIDSIISFFGGDFNNVQKVYVIDNTNETYDLLVENVKAASLTLYGDENSGYELIKDEKTFEPKALFDNEENKDIIVIVINESDTNVIEVEMWTKEYMDIYDTQILNTALNNTKVSLALSKTSIPVEEINKIYSSVEIKRIYSDEKKNDTDENMSIIMSTVFPILILPFFMLILFLVQMIGAEVNDEKTTRSMEIIISNVSPTTHFFAKVIAGNIFVIFQGILLFAFGGLGLFIRNLIGGGDIVGGIGSELGGIITQVLESNIGSTLIYIIPLTILLMVLTFIAYSLLAGILASITTNTEDFQQLQTPIIIISLISYYLSMMAGLFEGALFIKVLAFIPLISAVLAPSLLVLGQFGVIEVLISILLMVGFIYLLVKYGLKIYKVGILNYSSKDLWKKMFKAMKE